MAAPLWFRVAAADLLGEGRMTLCSTLAIAAVLAPLLVLAGLRAGVVEGMRATILENPRAREITSIANRTFSPEFLGALAARPDVSHLSPRTRQLAAQLWLVAGAERQGRAWLVPSASGDPLLGGEAPLIENEWVIASAPLAARLGLSPGDVVEGRTRRRRDGVEDLARLSLRVRAVAPAAASERDELFVSPELAGRLEDWEEWRSAELLADSPMGETVSRTFVGFRLYARRLDDVSGLVLALRSEGVETGSRMTEISSMLAVDRALGRLVLAIAAVAGTGLVLSLGAGLWANVERKRQLLAGLRLMGWGRRAVVAVPVTQALLLAVGGSIAGAALSLLAEVLVNSDLVGLPVDRAVSAINAMILATGAATVVVLSLCAAALAAAQAAVIEPYEAVRGA